MRETRSTDPQIKAPKQNSTWRKCTRRERPRGSSTFFFNERLHHKPARKAPATKAPTAAKAPASQRGLKFLEDEASAAQAAAKAALKHAKETSDAASFARSGAGLKKMPVLHTPRRDAVEKVLLEEGHAHPGRVCLPAYRFPPKAHHKLSTKLAIETPTGL